MERNNKRKVVHYRNTETALLLKDGISLWSHHIARVQRWRILVHYYTHLVLSS